MTSETTLSAKDAVNYRQLPKLQQQKQHKKAIKIADAILKNSPDHGETLSFKAISMNALSKKEEAYELAKMGLMKTKMKSYVSWHAYGLLYRSDRNYSEATKCYRRAISLSDDPVLLRDLGVLQIQSRDLRGFSNTKKSMLARAPRNRSSWVGFCLAQHMLGNYKLALLLLDSCLGSITSIMEKDRYELSEIFMYKAFIMEEANMYDEVLSYLDTFKDQITDKLSWKEQKARILLKLERFNDAREMYDQLIKINPDCYDYHRGIQACILGIHDVSDYSGCDLPTQRLSLTPEQRTELEKWYTEQGALMPKVMAFQRIAIDFFQGDDLEKKIDSYLKNGLRKGIPSLFSTLKPLYKAAFGKQPSSDELRKGAAARVDIIGKLIKSYVQENRTTSSSEEPPTFFLWCLFFWAQHQEAERKFDEALGTIDEAIEHTPTLVDLYHVKGRILKHAGDLNGAADVLEEGRKLDLADKWINSKSAKFLLRADRIEEAEATISLFTKHEGDSRGYLMDMQCMWFEIEAGHAYFRANNLAMALKFFRSVEKHFNDFEDDQLDFHGYCMRKFTLRAYTSFLRLIDRIRGHKYFAQAAHGAVACYIRIFDESKKYGPDKALIVPDMTNMSAAERKKAKNQLRKAEAKKKKREEEEAALVKATEESKKNNNIKRGRHLPVDDDPTGSKLLGEVAEKPLDHAHTLLSTLAEFATNSLEAQLDIFDVEIRRGKYLQCLRALKNAFALCGNVDSPHLRWRLVPFMAFVKVGMISYAPWGGLATSIEDRDIPVSVSMNLSPVEQSVIEQVVSEMDLSLDTAASLAKANLDKWTEPEGKVVLAMAAELA